MTSHINSLIRQALTTFIGVKDLFPQNLEKLRHLLDKTTATDVGFAGHTLLRSETWRKMGKAPVSYVDIYEDDDVSIGIFVLSPGMRLPLHDHPQMYGLIKVIAGSVQISSYTVMKVNEDTTLEAESHGPVVVRDSDPCCILDPEKRNLHELESIDGTAAFLDILAPPYDTYIPDYGQRTCSYYKPIKQLAPNKLLLKVVSSPSWFWSDTYPYAGPEILGKEIRQNLEDSEQ